MAGDGDWDEDAHPRGPDGKFGGGGGGKGSDVQTWARARAGGARASEVRGELKTWAQQKTNERTAAAPPAASAKPARDTPAQKMESAKAALSATLERGTKDGKPVTLAPIGLAAHTEIATKLADAHKEEFHESLSKVKEMAPADAKVKGRVKDPDSVVGKLDRKADKYTDAHSMQDVTGIRVVTKDLDGVKDTMRNLESSGIKIVSREDYITAPQAGSGYRSAHFIVETPKGLQKEIQIRTADQNKHAEWAHDAYKPQSQGQRDFLADPKNAAAMSRYSTQASEHFQAKAEGRTDTSMPKPPPGMAEHFGTIERPLGTAPSFRISKK